MDRYGIKIFSHDGYKLPDELEERSKPTSRFAARRVPELKSIPAARASPESAMATDPVLCGNMWNGCPQRSKGLVSAACVPVDCANGAATPVAHEVFRACGIEADFINDQPNGRNINETCGALHPEVVAKSVAASGGKYDLGVTFDGDADRALFACKQGSVVNGDAVLLLAGREMKAHGKLAAETIVATTMSNMGLEIALRKSGIRMLRAGVGDKDVLEQMQKTGAVLGGEQSGHIIFRDGDATTGDGWLTALRVLQVIQSSGKSLGELVADLKVFPQVVKNIRVREKKAFDQVPEISSAIKTAEEQLAGNGTHRGALFGDRGSGEGDGGS